MVFFSRHRAPVATGTGARAAPVQAMTVTAVFCAALGRKQIQNPWFHSFYLCCFVCDFHSLVFLFLFLARFSSSKPKKDGTDECR